MGTANPHVFTDELKSLAGLSRRQLDYIEKPSDVRKLFSVLALEGKRIPAEMMIGNHRHSATLKVVASGDDTPTLVIQVKNAPDITNQKAATISCEFLRKRYVFAVSFDSSSLREGRIALPDKVYMLHRREMDRRNVERLGLSCRVEGVEANISLEPTVVDLSAFGIGLKVKGASTVELSPLDVVDVSLSDTAVSPTSWYAEIAHVEPLPSGQGVRIGLKIIEDRDKEASRAFLSHLLEKIHPDVDHVQSDQDFSIVWDLIASRTPSVDPTLKETTIDHWKKTAEPVHNLAATFLHKFRGNPHSSISVHRMYEDTWLVHSFAFPEVLDVSWPLSMFERVHDFLRWQQQGAYVIGMWPGREKVLNRYYTRFAQAESDAGISHLEVLNVYVLATEHDATIDTMPASMLCRRADPEDYPRILELVHDETSPTYLESTDLAKQHIGLHETDIQYARAFVERSREFYVVCEHDRILGAVAIELCTLDSSIFGLFNSFRFFFSPELKQHKHYEDVARNTLNMVLERYRRQHIGRCSFLSKSDESWARKSPNLIQHVDKIYYMILPSSRLKALLRHLERTRWEFQYMKKRAGTLTPSVLKLFEHGQTPLKERKCVRYLFREDDNPLPCRLTGKNNGQLRGRVVDLTPYGACVNLEHADEKSLLGNVNVSIALPFQECSLQGQIRHRGARYAPGFRSVHNVIGIEFESKQWDEQARLREYLFPLMNPDVRMFAPSDYANLVELLARSDYFEYYVKQNNDDHVNNGEDTYNYLPHYYPNLVRTTVLADDTKIIGTHSFYRLNKRTWQLHQLVADPHIVTYKQKIPTKLILHSSLQYLCMDQAIDYFVTYFHDDAPIARTYFDVRDNHYNALDYAFIPFHMKLFCDTELPPPKKEERACGEATKSETKLVTTALSSIVAPIEFEALGYAEPTLTSFSSWWEKHDRQAIRKVFVHRGPDGDVRCFALVNVAPLGVNLLGVMDNFRVFDVPWCRTETTPYRLDLVRYVLRFYQQLGRHHVYFEEDEHNADEYASLPGNDLGRHWRLIAYRPCFMSALQFFLARFSKLEERLSRRMAENVHR